jgi:hypothetical protein
VAETQALPPYPTGDPGSGFGEQQQSFGGQQTFGGNQSFGGQQQQSFGGQQTFGGQQQQQPSFGGQQTFGGNQSYGGQQSFNGQGGGYPAASEETTRLGRAEVRSGGSAGVSRKAVIGGVVAVCAIGGILVAVLSGGGGGDAKHPKHEPVAKASDTKSAPAPAPAGGGSGTLPADAQAQAQGLYNLLSTASSSRQAVIAAVAAVGKCDSPANAQQTFTQASAQRQQLLTQLAALKVDKLSTGPQLVKQLTTAWQASAGADDAYAAWAGDMAGACDPGTAGGDPHKKAGDGVSGTASTAKKEAAATWNAIASQAGLTTLSDYQL